MQFPHIALRRFAIACMTASALACGAHYLQYERQRKVVQAATKEWLLHGTINGEREGYYAADRNGTIQ